MMNISILKKVLFTTAASLLFTINALAQDKSIDGAKAVTTQMKEKFTLNDGQYTKVYNVNLAFLQKVAENNKKANKTEKIKKLRVLEEERDTKLKSVLSDEQYKLFIATKSEDRK